MCSSDLRGKILNTERASLDRMMKSDTIESLITAVGGGYGEDFDLICFSATFDRNSDGAESQILI